MTKPATAKAATTPKPASQAPSARAKAPAQPATGGVATGAAPIDTVLCDGVYFGLHEDAYHADPALGSSNIRLLRQSPFEFWYGSKLNPLRPRDKDTDPLKVGKAYHKIILEGVEAFNGAYVRRPDDDEGATGPEKGALTKAANAEAAKAGKESLHGDDYDRAMISSAMIHKHPELEGAFDGGMPEVSAFWTDQHGVRQKVRWDYLKVRGFGDIKTIANEKRRPIAEACRWAIKDYRLDMQLAHYCRGRSVLPGLVASGAVFGDHDPEWLKRVAASREFAGQIVFFQKSGAPLVWSRTFTPHPDNKAYTTALDHVDEGLSAYRRCIADFGLDEMWMDVAKVEEFSQDEMPASFLYV